MIWKVYKNILYNDGLLQLPLQVHIDSFKPWLQSAFISWSKEVNSTLLLWAAWRFSRMFWNSIITCWSSSYLFLCSRYYIVHWALSKLIDKASMSTYCSWMISLRFVLWGPISVSSPSMRMKSVSRSPDGPSSYNGLLPRSWTYCADGESEAPSTPGGDNSHFAAINNCLVPFW